MATLALIRQGSYSLSMLEHLLRTPEEAAAILSHGGVVVFPTETVYGLGACAFNREAVEKIYVIKNRPRDNPLICHVGSIEDIEQLGVEITDCARVLLRAFTPGPVSFLLNM